MARGTFNVVDVTEILVHWHAGRSLSEIAEALGWTVKRCEVCGSSRAAGLSPGGPAKLPAEWPSWCGPGSRHWWRPGCGGSPGRRSTSIATSSAMLTAGITKQTIWQRLRDEHGLVASVSSVKRYIDANLPEEGLRSRVTVLRDDPPPGEEAQIDYGYLGWWTDPVGGRRRRVWAFVMVLATSRLMFVRLVLTMDQRVWTECHVEAFAFFGGIPSRLVPDNLRTGVARPDLYDPKINRSYAELACRTAH